MKRSSMVLLVVLAASVLYAKPRCKKGWLRVDRECWQQMGTEKMLDMQSGEVKVVPVDPLIVVPKLKKNAEPVIENFRCPKTYGLSFWQAGTFEYKECRPTEAQANLPPVLPR